MCQGTFPDNGPGHGPLHSLPSGCHLLIDKERVRHPDKADILGSNYKLIDPEIRAIEGKPPVRPELSEVLKMK